ncbi:helix-turn-helix domain-containing protein [Salmonella enterica]|nr:DNA-binding protein [Salmonella enterica subsp. enterica]EDW9587959.1 DNA-binding protein [Salmonella enterica subsp. enterica]EED9672765.1 DNA-binding protein [Salmonella enterica subsp. enterica]EHJ7466340.1 helix-turn-helix domain-containing protein [Salmonella enterica]EHJ7518794.1 helix-turn-helix domain-containing protein [Salmonella enterica]
MIRNEVIGEDWHPGQIVGEVRAQGLTLRKLSLRAGLAQDTLKNALYRHVPKYESIIADAIGRKPEEIWPSRYTRKVA